jgi:hypothetical protein
VYYVFAREHWNAFGRVSRRLTAGLGTKAPVYRIQCFVQGVHGLSLF